MWPPDLSKAGETYDFSHMGNRVAELVFFFNETCPLDESVYRTLPIGQPFYDFIDGHHSLGALESRGTSTCEDASIGSPWVTRPFTIVGHSALVVRSTTRTAHGRHTRIRIVEPFEVQLRATRNRFRRLRFQVRSPGPDGR